MTIKRLLGSTLPILLLMGSTGNPANRPSPPSPEAPQLAVLGSPFEISDASTNANVERPTVAYNSVEDEFLVVWNSSDGVRARRVLATGAAIGSVLDIGATGAGSSARRPAIAFDAIDNQYLVVWTNGFGVFGQRLDGAMGAELGADDFTITEMRARVSDVAHNPDDNEWLVVWEGRPGTGGANDGDPEIYGQRLEAPTGDPVGETDFRISDTGDDSQPSIAYNEVDGEYLVVWRGPKRGLRRSLLFFTDWEAGDIYGQRLVGSTSAKVGADGFRISDTGPFSADEYTGTSPDVAHCGLVNEYLVAWYGRNEESRSLEINHEVFGQRLSGATGDEIGANGFALSRVTGSNGDRRRSSVSPRVAAGQGTGRWQVVWHHSSPRPHSVRGRQVDPDRAEVQATPIIFGREAIGPRLQGVDVACSSRSGGCLVVWAALTVEGQLALPGS